MEEFLFSLDEQERRVTKPLVEAVRKYVPQVEEGLSYGMHAFKIDGRPLIGFGKNKFGLNIYPFDPRVITDAHDELKNFEHGKGVIRTTTENPISIETLLLLVDLRTGYLNSKSN